MKRRIIAFISPALFLAGSAQAMTSFSTPNSWGVISIGSDSSYNPPWVISGQPAAGDTGNNYIYRYVFSNGSGHWQLSPNAARQITVSSDGIPWVLRADGSIWKWTGSSFTQPNGIGTYQGGSSCATSISVASGDRAWIVGCSGAADSALFYWTGSAWSQPTQPLSAKYVFTDGTPGYATVTWAVRSNGDIYSLGPNGTGAGGWQFTGGGGQSFGVTNVGYPLCINAPANAVWEYDSTASTPHWIPYQAAPAGKTLKQLTSGWAMTTDGGLWQL